MKGCVVDVLKNGIMAANNYNLCNQLCAHCNLASVFRGVVDYE